MKACWRLVSVVDQLGDRLLVYWGGGVAHAEMLTAAHFEACEDVIWLNRAFLGAA